MKSALAVLTYNRKLALQETLLGIRAHCERYPLAVFEDCGCRDGTEASLLKDAGLVRHRPELKADEYTGNWGSIFMGTSNLGVAGNSNRAIQWLLTQDADHFCLLNDDLHVLGDFAAFYAEAHVDLDVGLFCFTDFEGESYRTVPIRHRGYMVHVMPRFTGIMLSFTRSLIEKIGGFDTTFGQFGEEHSDFTIRARMAGGIQLSGRNQHCLDVQGCTPTNQPAPRLLRHQEVATSVQGLPRQQADVEASRHMQRASRSYLTQNVYRPLTVHIPEFAGGHDRTGGIQVARLDGYRLVA